MTPEDDIREKLKRSSAESILVELTAQFAAFREEVVFHLEMLNQKFSDYFQTLDTEEEMEKRK